MNRVLEMELGEGEKRMMRAGRRRRDHRHEVSISLCFHHGLGLHCHTLCQNITYPCTTTMHSPDVAVFAHIIDTLAWCPRVRVRSPTCRAPTAFKCEHMIPARFLSPPPPVPSHNSRQPMHACVCPVRLSPPRSPRGD